MKWSEYFIPTLKEDPREAEASSHKLMLRAGLARQLSAGIYSYLPSGLKVLRNIESIIRQEMNKRGALEVFLPAVHPEDIWKESGRNKTLIEAIGFSFKDRRGNVFILGPTHEEIVTDLVKGEIKSYRQLPLNLYQIQTKFRDEPRPRFGVIRSKEFTMKDAYSFDKDRKGLDESYKKMYEAYCEIMNKCELPYLVAEASSGMMGGEESAEFMVVSSSGEDIVARCKKCAYVASLEAAECLKPDKAKKERQKPLKEVNTPATYTVEGVTKLLKEPADKLLKTLIYKIDNKFIAVLIRGDKSINEAKLKIVLGAENLALADEEKIERITGAPLGFAGPVGLEEVKIIADYQIEHMSNFITGANKKDKHLMNVNLERDFRIDKFYDLRYIDKQDKCPKCKAEISIISTMEIGHIFKLGTRYSKDLKANFLDKDGKEKPFVMGCYGIGVNRLMAAIIELNHDQEGIIWPQQVAPFKVLVLPLQEGADCSQLAHKVYSDLQDNEIDVLLDDRNLQPGAKFKDADLIGIPYQVIIGPKNLKKNKVEIKIRKENKRRLLAKDEVVDYIKKILTT
jgi:prolyl-tRNA synthetase